MTASTSKARQIVITGVSRSLGRAMVDGFIERGHIVHGCARDAKAIAELLQCRHGREL
jgi:NAD(P)-dependent dehydrogenase (short-subunit alcohol dehydrogenase family)